MATPLILVPSKDFHFFSGDEVTTIGGASKIEKFEKAADFIDTCAKRHAGSTLIGAMGGAGDGLFVRASLLGLNVQRLPLYRLIENGLPKGAAAEVRAKALQATYAQQPELFYELSPLDQRINLLREVTRARKKVQDVYRKPGQLMLAAAERELSPLAGLPRTAGMAQQIEGVRAVFADSAMVAGAKEDEKKLEHQLEALLKQIPIWELMKGSARGLPVVKGVGPALGGAIIGEIGDIRRFRSSDALRAYARLHLTSNNGQAHFPKRQAGKLSNWNPYLGQAFWWWYDYQLPRVRGGEWFELYQYQLATEFSRHPEPVEREFVKKDGLVTTLRLYTPSHVKKRAKRWTGSKLAQYVFDLWSASARGEDIASWYDASGWPRRFERTREALATPLYQQLLEQYQQAAKTAGGATESEEEVD